MFDLRTQNSPSNKIIKLLKTPPRLSCIVVFRISHRMLNCSMPRFVCASCISCSTPPEEPINNTLVMSTAIDTRMARRSQIILLLVKGLLMMMLLLLFFFFLFHITTNNITRRKVPETAASTVHVYTWRNKTPISKVEKTTMSERRPDRKYLKRNAIDMYPTISASQLA
jgi:hypothetical protein